MMKQCCGRIGLCCLVLCALTCSVKSQAVSKKCTEPAKFDGGNRDDVKRSVVDTNATEALANYFPQPLAGFNRSRNPFAGTKLTINEPAGLLEKVSVDAIASNKSDEERVRAAGSRERASGL